MMGVPGAFGLKGERGPSGPKGNTGLPGTFIFFLPCDKMLLLFIATFAALFNNTYFFVPQVSMGSKVTKVLYYFQ